MTMISSKILGPLIVITGARSSIIGWVFDYFRAEEAQGLLEDLHRVKDKVYKLSDDQKILFLLLPNFR